MPDLDPRYAPYGSLALLTVESASGMARMRNPAIAAIALANAGALHHHALRAAAPRAGATQTDSAIPSWCQ